ncbi:unnamed protein product [Oncorhynchus mykiss]|uniref:Pericentrin/AKAP-450 centrosomal targeting domain-containing protein n=1 Tax=Oncorhynchus mykiss TaxID=8022 RepID=A0A060XP85_ONCMY|nr:unnamed protein product [Oncorhynchus mykiss]
MDEDERQRKLDAGRAKLASFRQKRAKGDGQVAQKKTQKRKGPSPTQNDGPAQGRPLGMDLQTDGSATQQDDMCNNEEPQCIGETDQSHLPEVQWSQGHLEQHHPQEGSSVLGRQAVSGHPEEMEVVGEEVLVVRTGKDQLKQLQAAVEKRNEIISRLSCNLQEALESRDKEQQEAFSLTGQIQALKMQVHAHTHTHFKKSGCESPEQCIDPEMDVLIHTLRRELLEEREKNQLMLSQLEEERTGREEERREIHQYKEEKEVLNRELQELRRRLEEERERRNEKEDEREIRERQEEEKRRLGEEVQRVRQVLGERGRTREELGFKASKDKLNQAKASVEEDGEREGEEREECLLDLSLPTDGTPLLERYLPSALPSHTHLSWANETLEECSFLEGHSLLDNSGNYRFELDSDIISGGDQSQLSFSQEEQTHFSVPQSTAQSHHPDPENETLPSFASQWQNDPLSVSRDASETSERLSETSESQEVSDLGKELLIQQCGDLREEVALREREKETEREKTEVESELLCLRQNLWNLEELQAQGVREREEGRRREEEMDRTTQRMEKVMEEFQRQLRDKEEEVAEEREKWEEERQEKDEEVQGVRRLLEEQRREREQEVKALLEQQMRSVEEATERLRRSHSEDVQELQEKHQEEVSELSGRLERELCEQRHSLEEEQKRQISLIKQVNEREHQRMLLEMMSQQREELSRLKAELSGDQRESMETAHQAELLQIQSQQALELEALRLSLTNHQTTQLELSQTNLQREREASLSELQASLREKWAQERAVLQARQQFEVERLRAESEERIQREQQEYHRNMDALRQECESRVSQERASMEERQAAEIVALRSRWQQESEKAQSELQTQLSEAWVLVSSTQAAFTQTGADLSEARASLEELQRLEGELSQAWTDRDAAARESTNKCY